MAHRRNVGMNGEHVERAAGALENLAMAETRSVVVRLATKKDAFFIAKLVRELADYEKLRPACVATEEGLEHTLFNLPPFQGPTVFMLETASPPAVASLDPVASPPNLATMGRPPSKFGISKPSF